MSMLSKSDLAKIIAEVVSALQPVAQPDKSAKIKAKTTTAPLSLPPTVRSDNDSFTCQVIESRAKLPKYMFERGHCVIKQDGEVVVDLLADSEGRNRLRMTDAHAMGLALGDVVTFQRAGQYTWKVGIVTRGKKTDFRSSKTSYDVSDSDVDIDSLFGSPSNDFLELRLNVVAASKKAKAKTKKPATLAQLAHRERFSTVLRLVKCNKCQEPTRIGDMTKTKTKTKTGLVLVCPNCVGPVKTVKRGTAIIEEPNTPVYVTAKHSRREIKNMLRGKTKAQKESLTSAIALGYTVPK